MVRVQEMNTYRTRRATTDDLEQLVGLWQAAQMPALELEKRFTEFQVVEDSQGRLLAATGLQIEGHEARIHNETFADFSLTDTLRPLLWQRFQVVAANHGFYRLWTDETSPFWKKDAGFVEASKAVLSEMPEAFGQRNQVWLTLRLRDEVASPAALDREFERFKEAGRLQKEKMVRQAGTLRVLAITISALLFLFAVVAGFYLLKHS